MHVLMMEKEEAGLLRNSSDLLTIGRCVIISFNLGSAHGPTTVGGRQTPPGLGNYTAAASPAQFYSPSGAVGLSQNTSTSSVQSQLSYEAGGEPDGAERWFDTAFYTEAIADERIHDRSESMWTLYQDAEEELETLAGLDNEAGVNTPVNVRCNRA